MPNDTVWDFIESYGKKMRPGSIVDTSLLGKVRYIKNRDGSFEGIIPDDLQQQAARHGFRIVAAYYISDIYTLRKLTQRTHHDTT